MKKKETNALSKREIAMYIFLIVLCVLILVGLATHGTLW